MGIIGIISQVDLGIISHVYPNELFYDLGQGITSVYGFVSVIIVLNARVELDD